MWPSGQSAQQRLLYDAIKYLLIQGKVWPVPGGKQNSAVSAVSSIPVQANTVPGCEGPAVYAGDLVVASLVGLGHALETVQGQEVKVPLGGILLELSNLEPWLGSTRLQAIDGVESTLLEVFLLILDRGAIGNTSKETKTDKKERRMQAGKKQHDERVW